MVDILENYTRSLCWFRRDLRDFDHAALFYALKHSEQVFAVFVFDQTILADLPATDKRIAFIWQSVAELKTVLQQRGGDLIILHAAAVSAIPQLAQQLAVQAVFCNHDYEPAAIARDAEIAQILQQNQQVLHTFKDQVIFERAEIVKANGTPYAVFTPYKKAWLAKLNASYMQSYPVARYWKNLAPPVQTPSLLPSLSALGFAPNGLESLGVVGGMQAGAARLADFVERLHYYAARRDFPAMKGVSYLSVHLRFGTVSIRELVQLAAYQQDEGADTWLSELIWREFYQMLLWHHPKLVSQTYRPEYNQIAFPNDTQKFQAWCNGQTGYPLVDAAMQQILQTGFMHNRLRMVVASFLVKDCHIDWRWGEAFFAQHLLDFDLAANNGGWQWCASTGCDAQPYFRIFNPITQSERFDAEGKFIRRYLPQLSMLPNKWIHAPWQAPTQVLREAGIVLGENYPHPLIDHAESRLITLALYKQIPSVALSVAPE